MKEIYLVVCSGQGDTNICMVDKRTYDWILSDDWKVPDHLKRALVENNPGDSSEELAAWIKETEDYGRDGNPGGGSDNDKALFVQACFPLYLSFGELLEKEFDIKVAGEYQGYIY